MAIRDNFRFGISPAAEKKKSIISCGTVIETDTVLSNNVESCLCDIQPALSVVGGATLDLGNHNVSCLSSISDMPCIALQGEGGTIKGKGGIVHQCGAGILVAGDGNHTIQGITVKDTFAGIFITSDKNIVNGTIVSSVSDRRNSVGIRLLGASNNQILNNDISNSMNGIDLWAGCNDTLIEFNKIQNLNYGQGILATGQYAESEHVHMYGIQIIENEIKNTLGAGIMLLILHDAIVSKNIILDSDFGGILLGDVSNAQILDNKIAIKNDDSPNDKDNSYGILLSASHNVELVSNHFLAGGRGIEVIDNCTNIIIIDQ